MPAHGVSDLTGRRAELRKREEYWWELRELREYWDWTRSCTDRWYEELEAYIEKINRTGIPRYTNYI